MKEMYSSPELEILYFMPLEHTANNVTLPNDVASDETADAYIPGGGIPGW